MNVTRFKNKKRNMCPRVLCTLQFMRPSEADAHPPWVVCKNFVLFLHNASVRAFVDGIGHYGDVVVFQGDVVWVRVLQQLPVFVPAENRRIQKPSQYCIIAATKTTDNTSQELTIYCPSLMRFSSHNEMLASCPHWPACVLSSVEAAWGLQWGKGILSRKEAH